MNEYYDNRIAPIESVTLGVEAGDGLMVPGGLGGARRSPGTRCCGRAGTGT